MFGLVKTSAWSNLCDSIVLSTASPLPLLAHFKTWESADWTSANELKIDIEEKHQRKQKYWAASH